MVAVWTITSDESRQSVYISNPEELAEFCERAGRSHVLAVDTEFIRERTYYPRLCLVQVGTEDETAAVDPILIEDLSPLARLFEDGHITKVFHACSQDLEVIYDHMGVVPAPVFDTQLAASFLGHRMQLGYGALVESYTGVHLPKAEALTDWSRRPLDEEQLRYAEDDVRYLPGIYRRMVDELVARDRLSWVEPEMEALAEPGQYARDPQEAYLHLKRASSLTRRQLAVAREVCAWREEAAASHDIPRKWVMSDEVVVEVCKRLPKTGQQLARIRGTSQLSAREVETVVAAVARGLGCPSSEMPRAKRKPRPPMETEGVVDLMNAVLRIKSDESGVATQLIATRDELVAFAEGSRSGRLSKGWRHELVGSSLERLLAGEVGLTVKDGHIELL